MSSRRQELHAAAVSAADIDFDEDTPEFIAACLAAIKSPPTGGTHAAVSLVREPVDGAQPDLVRQLAAEVEELRAALAAAQTQAQIQIRNSSAAKASDRLADATALQDAERREAQARADLQALRVELDSARRGQGGTSAALDAAMQGEARARSELDATRAAMANHESVVEQLRRTIAERDREIEEVQRLLLQAEDARSADTSSLRSAMLSESQARAELTAARAAVSDRDATIDHLSRTIVEREREIVELQQRILRTEEARAADAAEFIVSLSKLKS